ncbi:uncharacterized protein [Anabrus simplex]|uniref:uncharacterized protein n=1 Tax=Anabrus simplex TaxID=316456 RepID=UPI0035A2D0FF
MVPAEEVQADNPQEHGKCAAISKYKRRSGACTQKGTKFEIKMAALVYLRAKRLLKSFAISINDALAGDFDDIVLTFNSGSKKYELLMQLKHLDRNVAKAALASKSGKLSLNEMFSSVKSRFIPPTPAPKDTVCILFTNTAVNLGTSQRASNIDPLVTDLLCTSDTDSVLEVNINDEVCTTFKEQPGATEFVRNFFIFSSQVDVDHLDEIIKQEFIKFTFRIIPNYRNLEIVYLDNIETYWDMTGKVPYLTEDWGKWSSIQHLLTGNNILLPHIRFDEQILNTLAQKLLDSNHQKIHVVCRDSSVLLTSMKVNQALVKLRNQRHLFTSTDEQKENLNIVLKLWESNSYDILTIGWNSSNCTYKLEIDENIFLKKQKKLILISDGRRSISDIFTDRLVDRWYDLDEAFSFSQLDNSFQETVLNQPINLQGIEVKLSDLGVRKELLSESLMSFLNCGNIQLGRKLEFPCKRYIPRTLCKQVAIKKDILGVAEIPNEVCVEGVTDEKLRSEINKVRMSKDLGNFQEPTKVKSVANAGIRSQHSVDPIHTLEMKDDMLYWRCSSGDPGYLYEFLNVTQGEIEDVKRFIENCKTSNPKEDVLVTAGMRKVIVAGEPGIGKSDLFLHIAHKLKDLYPAFWVIPLNLEDVAKYMNEKENCIVNKESVFRMLTSATDVQESPVEKTFLEEAIENSGKIFILCDGFDEIYPKYSELVLEVFNTILETKLSGLWVSSRQAAVDKLENCLQAKAFSLEPFTKDESLRYLRDILGWDDANKIIEFIQKSTCDGTNPVSSYPLHLMMICDLIDSGGFPTNGKLLNLYEMYRSFINIKLEKYLDNTVKDTHVHMRHIYAKVFIESHMICSIIALDILNELQEEQRNNILKDFFNNYREIVRGGHEKTGIIDGLSEDDRPRFVHRTFAEYFAALWLVKNKDSNLKYIGKIIFDTHQNVLRAVFNRLLAENCPIHLAVLDNDISDLCERLKNPDLDSKDGGGRTPLHLASLSDDKVSVKMMEEILHYQPKLEIRDKLLNSTPLYYAVKAEMWDGVRLLLQHGAHVENSISEYSYVADLKERVRFKNSRFTTYLDLEFEINWPIFVEYKTILHLAAVSGSEDCIKMLLESRAKVEMRDVNGNTPLHDAASKGRTTAVKLLLDKGACFTAANKFGDTPLHMTVRLGHKSNTSIVELLLNRGAETNVKNQDGDTPLHDGVRYGNENLVMLLLTHEADVRVQNKDGNTPLHLAVSRNGSENELIVKLLLNSGAVTAAVNKNGDTPLHIAIKKHNLRMVWTLLQYKASISATNKHGDTPLHVAAREQKKETVSVIKLLFQNRARANVKNKYGNTPLHVAVRYSKLDVVQLLLDRRASTTVRNNNGETPLHEAVKELDSDIVELLLKNKASATDVNKEQDTPLHIAAKYSNPRTVELLLKCGAKTGAVNKDGDTPLHVAIGFRNRSNEHAAAVIAQLLGRDKSCVLIANNVGDTPLHIAVEKKNYRIVELLLEKGVNMNVKNRNGDTPLSIAEKYGYKEIVKLLQDYASKC